MPKRPTIDDIIAKRKPRTKTVWIALDADLLARMEELERQIRIEERVDERENRPPVAPRLKAELDALHSRENESAQPFTFQQLPRREYRTLLDAHPSDNPQKAWDDDTFAPALIAACAIDPVIPLEAAQTLCDEWGWAEFNTLFLACLNVNAEESQVPFSVRESAGTRNSPSSSATASNTAED